MAATIDISDLQKKFSHISRELLPSITAAAVNRTAEYVKDTETQQIPQHLDRPTPFTQKAVFVGRYARKSGPWERDVFLRDQAANGTPPVKYLAPEVYGGPRRHKRFERALIAAGIMEPNEWAVTAGSYKTNQYGNIPAGTYTRLLSQVKASRDAMQNVTPTSRAKGKRQGKVQYFAARNVPHLRRGIYARKGEFSLQPVLLFTTSKPMYPKRFDFRGIARKAYAEEFARQFKLQADLRMGRI